MDKENYFGESAMNNNPKKKIRLEIRDNSVTEKKIAENAITTDKIANGSVTKDKIATGAITKDKLSNDILNGIAIERITEKEIEEIVGEKGDIQ